MTFAERGGWWVAGQVVLLSLIVVALLLVEADLGITGGVRWLVVGLGAALTAFAATLGIAGIVTLGQNLTPFPEPAAGGRMVAHGPYRLVRHPIYGAVALGASGLSFLDVNAAAFALSLVLTAFFVTKAQHEESRLGTVYPEYVDYAREVRRRLIPWVL